MLEPNSKRYSTTFGALTIVGDLLHSNSPDFHVRLVLRDLVVDPDETGGFDVLVDTDVLIVAQVPGPRVIGYAPKSVPRLLPTRSTSTGKVLLAGLSDDELRSHHASALRDARAARRSEDEFLQELVEVRRRGYGVARDEVEPGAAAAAAPVLGDGDVFAASRIGGPTHRITEDRVEALAADVIPAAKSIAEIVALNGGGISGLLPATEGATIGSDRREATR